MFFWQEGGNSISSAIFASVLLDAIATRSTLARHGYFKDVCRRFLELSHKFEVLAIGVLDECYRENTLMVRGCACACVWVCCCVCTFLSVFVSVYLPLSMLLFLSM